MASSDVDLIGRLVDRHTTGQDRLRSGVYAGVSRILVARAGIDFYRHAAQDEGIAQLAAISDAASTASGAHTITYLDAVLAALGVKASRKVPPQGRLRAADPRVVWARPFEQFRYAYSINGGSNEAALEAALTRANQIADTDLTLAVRDAGVRHSTANKAVTSYRRVIRPELAKTGQSCGLCIVAAQNAYKKAELMPIHQGCNCTVIPVIGDNDPGVYLNNDALQAIYDDAGALTRSELQRVRYTVEQNSELGPTFVLVPDKEKK